MKKMFIILATLGMVAITKPVSVEEFIQQGGMVEVTNGKINLSNKGLTSLKGLGQLVQRPHMVKELYLSGNNLVSISASDIQQFPNLEILDVSNNRLTSFPSLTLQNLKKLNLENNMIKEIKGLVMPQLKKFAADNNPLKSITNVQAPALKKFKIKEEDIGRAIKAVKKQPPMAVRELWVDGENVIEID